MFSFHIKVLNSEWHSLDSNFSHLCNVCILIIPEPVNPFHVLGLLAVSLYIFIHTYNRTNKKCIIIPFLICRPFHVQSPFLTKVLSLQSPSKGNKPCWSNFNSMFHLNPRSTMFPNNGIVEICCQRGRDTTPRVRCKGCCIDRLDTTIKSMASWWVLTGKRSQVIIHSSLRIRLIVSLTKPAKGWLTLGLGTSNPNEPFISARIRTWGISSP